MSRVLGTLLAERPVEVSSVVARRGGERAGGGNPWPSLFALALLLELLE
jgi:hypothetical protein